MAIGARLRTLGGLALLCLASPLIVLLMQGWRWTRAREGAFDEE